MSSSATEKPLRRDAERNRLRLVAAAQKLFASEGIDVTVEEITRAAGVGMGTLYRHFPTKDDLVDAALESALDTYVDLARQALGEPDGWIGLTAFLEQALALYAANRCLMEVIQTTEHGSNRARATRRLIRPLVHQLVERAQVQGTLRRDVTAEDVPVVFWATSRIIETTESIAPGHWRRHLQLLLDGLRPAAATPLPRPPLDQTQLARAAKPRRA
jgi:AcrR family transcriptional regulator